MKAPTDWLGPTPWESIVKAYEEHCEEGFNMKLAGGDAKIATAAINQGIDSHLEAVSFLEEPEWTCGKLSLVFDCRGLLVFLRRLYEYSNGEAVDSEDEHMGDLAQNLRSGILECLGIEEI